MGIRAIQDRLAAFATERDWQQFHTPKNLAMALTVEAAELAEPFMWLTLSESMRLRDEKPDVVNAVAAEAADVFIFLIRLCDVLGIDLEHAVDAKIAENGKRYPVETAKGNATKALRKPKHA